MKVTVTLINPEEPNKDKTCWNVLCFLFDLIKKKRSVSRLDSGSKWVIPSYKNDNVSRLHYKVSTGKFRLDRRLEDFAFVHCTFRSVLFDRERMKAKENVTQLINLLNLEEDFFPKYQCWTETLGQFQFQFQGRNFEFWSKVTMWLVVGTLKRSLIDRQTVRRRGGTSEYSDWFLMAS